MNQQASGQRGGRKGKQIGEKSQVETFLNYPEKNHAQCLQESFLKHENGWLEYIFPLW